MQEHSLHRDRSAITLNDRGSAITLNDRGEIQWHANSPHLDINMCASIQNLSYAGCADLRGPAQIRMPWDAGSVRVTILRDFSSLSRSARPLTPLHYCGQLENANIYRTTLYQRVQQRAICLLLICRLIFWFKLQFQINTLYDRPSSFSRRPLLWHLWNTPVLPLNPAPGLQSRHSSHALRMCEKNVPGIKDKLRGVKASAFFYRPHQRQPVYISLLRWLTVELTECKRGLMIQD